MSGATSRTAPNIITTKSLTTQANKVSAGSSCSNASRGRRGLFHWLSRRVQGKILILLLCLWPLAELVTTSSGTGRSNDSEKEQPGSIKTRSTTATTTTNAITSAISAGNCARALSKRFHNDEALVAPAKTEPTLDPSAAFGPLALSSGTSFGVQVSETPAKVYSEPDKSYDGQRRRKKGEKKVPSGSNGQSIITASDNEERAMKRDIASKAIKKVHKKNKKIQKKLHKLAHKTKHDLHQLVHLVHG